jgi:hypothetical protein
MSAGAHGAARAPDPFAALGLAAGAEVTDDDVRAAWRRIAAATHPDRDDGGSPERYAEAASAYATLRTSFGRGEALADLAATAPTPGWRRWIAPPLSSLPPSPRLPTRWPTRWPTARWLLRLAVRLLAVAAIAAFAFAAAGWSPGTVAVLAGAATWLTAFLWRRHALRRDR